MKKIIILLLMSSFLLAKMPVYKVLMSEEVPKGYDSEVFKKVIVLMTEGRLYLQKKYRKKVEFEYIPNILKSKDEIIKTLKQKNARFYVKLEIKKKKAKKNIEKVLYNVKIFDLHKKRFKTVKTKATIRDKKVVLISKGNIKSAGKKIAKILKKK